MNAGAPIAAFFALCGAGALAALVAPERRNPGIVALFGSLAAAALLAAGAALLVGAPFHVALWRLLSFGMMRLGADRLSAVFLFVGGLVFLPVSLFSASYLPKYLGQASLRYFSVLYFALLAAIVLVLIADDAVSFLIAWELMSIAGYLLVVYEPSRDANAQAGFVMLAMSEAGTIAAMLAFLVLAAHAGGIDFGAMRAAPDTFPAALGWSVFLLSFAGFAVKAGLVPVNSWLPPTYLAAPTNAAALLAAAVENLGIYGILRVNLDLHPAAGAAPGLIVLVIGGISALVGILYATIAADMKRLLAHSTIENMGIIAAGIGAAMTFRASGHPVAAGVALIAALYHLANHSVLKALLFLGTGAVEAGAGTRDLDRLGGIARRMPWTSAWFLIGVLGISALPPLNGFVSEWLTLQAVLRSAILTSAASKIVFAISGALLALTAGLAVTCFVKAFAMGFLGLPRSEGAARSPEASRTMRAPLALLAAMCLLLGILPTYVIPVLDRAATPLAGASATAALVPPFFNAAVQQQERIPAAFVADFHDIGAQLGEDLLPGRGLVVLYRGGAPNPVVFAMSTAYMFVTLAFLLTLVFIVFRLLTRGRVATRGAVWDGGLRRLWPQITYTATGFSNPVRVVFAAILRPRAGADSTEAVARHFRTAIRRQSNETHVVDRWVLQPPVLGLSRLAQLARRMHVGSVNAYAAYLLLVMLLVLVLGVGLH